jgi:hypothetical protein
VLAKPPYREYFLKRDSEYVVVLILHLHVSSAPVQKWHAGWEYLQYSIDGIAFRWLCP